MAGAYREDVLASSNKVVGEGGEAQVRSENEPRGPQGERGELAVLGGRGIFKGELE